MTTTLTEKFDHDWEDVGLCQWCGKYCAWCNDCACDRPEDDFCPRQDTRAGTLRKHFYGRSAVVAGHKSRIQRAQQSLLEAKTMMEVEIREAHEAGVSFVKIGEWLGLTEGAIRMQFKRKGWNR